MRLDTEFVQQFYEVRIGPVVENNEAGVDLLVFAIEFNSVGVGVPADMPGRLIDRDVVVIAMQLARGDVAGDAAADNGDFHGVRGDSRRAFSMRTGTGRRSQITPSMDSSRKPYQVKSSSHQ